MEYTCNRTNMELFVKELETTDKVQRRGMLRDKRDKYCCLGICCDLYEKITGQGNWETFTHAGNHIFTCNNGYDSSVSLPGPVYEWLGVKTGNVPILPVKYHQLNVGLQACSAIDLNDEVGYSFKQIAAELRKTYLN